MARGRKPGFKVSPETKAKMSAAHLGKKRLPETKAQMKAAQARRRAWEKALEEEAPPDDPVPSCPEENPGAALRIGLLKDLSAVSVLAQTMCGGLGVGNIAEWQQWVREVIHEAKHHVRRSAGL